MIIVAAAVAPLGAVGYAPVIAKPPRALSAGWWTNAAAVHAIRRQPALNLGRLRRAESARRVWLHSAEAVDYRNQSQTAYEHLASAGAQKLFEQHYRSLVRAVSHDPEQTVQATGRVVRYLNPEAAIVARKSGAEVLERSTTPLEVRGRPVDLTLSRHHGAYVPHVASTSVSIATSLAGGVSVGRFMKLALIAHNRNGVESAGNTVYFSNVLRATDATATPTAGGVDLATVLRGRGSPRTFRYRVTLRAGYRLVARRGGAVIRSGGRDVAYIPDPSARDAQGSTIPTTMRLAGRELIVSLRTSGERWAYPILVDPQVNSDWAGWQCVTYMDGNISCPSPGVIDEDPGFHAGEYKAWIYDSPVVLTGVEYDDVSMTGDSSPNWGWNLYSAANDGAAECDGPGNNETGTIFNGEEGSGADAPPARFWESGPDCGIEPRIEFGAGEQGSGVTGSAEFSVGSALLTSALGTSEYSDAERYGDDNPSEPDQVRACSGEPVDCYSGNYYESTTDMALPGAGPGFAFTRTYNAEAAAAGQSGPLGYGWTSSFGDQLDFDNAAGTATLIHGNGSSVVFAMSGTSFVPINPLNRSTLTEPTQGVYQVVLPDNEVELFNGSGQLTTRTDSYGRSLRFTYSNGELATATDAAGRRMTFSYDPNGSGKLDSVTGPMGTVNYSYDSSGNLTNATTLDGYDWGYGYDDSHRMTTLTNPDGGTTQNVYDDANRVTSQTDPVGNTTGWAYPTAGETDITYPSGHTAVEEFDASGQLLSITRAPKTGAQTKESYVYNDAEEMIAALDGDGHGTDFRYNDAGEVTEKIAPDGDTTTWTYDDQRHVTSQTLPSGIQTTNTWTGPDLTAVATTGIGGSPTETTSYGYDSTGDVTSKTDPLGNTTTYTYNAAGNETSATSPLGNKQTWTYDGSGYLTSYTAPNGNVKGGTPAKYTTTYINDARGQPVEVDDPRGGVTHFTYNAFGVPATQTDQNGAKTQSTYNAAGQLTKVTRPDGTAIAYAYDPDGQIASETSGSGTVGYQYDQAGYLMAETTGNVETDYTHDAAGQTTNIEYASGATDRLLYTKDGQLARRIGPAPVSYTYNVDGYRTSMTDSSGTTSYTYDSLGRLQSITNGAGETVGYSYDADNSLTGLTYPGGNQVTQSWDADGHETGVTDWLGKTTKFGYDANGNVTATTFPAATNEVDKYAYDADDDLTSVAFNKSGTNLGAASYTRDQTGRVQTYTPTGLGDNAASASYSPTDQLTSLGNTSLSYNAGGDATSPAPGQSLSYNPADELTSGSLDGSPETFSYNSAGDRTAATSTQSASTYTYNELGQLTHTTITGGGAVAAGDSHSLAINQAGQVYAWGDNTSGQLGNGTTAASTSPVQVASLSGATAVAAGAAHSLALMQDGTVWSWGNNSEGQLGDGTTTSSETPEKVGGVANATAVASGPGANDSLALTADGSVWAWGANESGELGDNSTNASASAVEVQLTGPASAIASGSEHNLATLDDGSLWAWGLNSAGQLGDGSSTNSSVPVQVSGLSNVVQAAGGSAHSLALERNGTVWAWGSNANGQLGNGTKVSASTPQQVPGIQNAVAIAAGGNDSFAVLADGSVLAWGQNKSGQLGIGSTTNALTPTTIGTLTGASAIAAGASDTLIVSQPGVVAATGLNSSGQLGTGNTTSRSKPGTISGVAAVQANAPAQYVSDGDSLRASMTVDGQTNQFAWDLDEATPRLLTDGTLSFIYGPDGDPVEQISQSGTVTYLHHDATGSTRLLTNSAGKAVATLSYDPYGALTSETGSVTTPLRWQGQYQDPQSGLYYLRARYYDPATGQFMTRDPDEALTHDPYAYAADDPLNGSDPTGLNFWDDLGNAAAGFGDTVTFGGTAWVRRQLGVDNVNYNSGAYHVGEVAGTVESTALVGAGAEGVLRGALADQLVNGIKVAPIAGPLGGGVTAEVYSGLSEDGICNVPQAVDTVARGALRGVSTGLTGQIATGFFASKYSESVSTGAGIMLDLLW